jgi:predicted dienelactone hydrolase
VSDLGLIHALALLVASVAIHSTMAADYSEDYDPLAPLNLTGEKTIDLVVKDQARSRSIPVLIYLPSNTTAAPVILFSHGLGGTREGSRFLGKHWAARGYVAVFMQHAGSDDAVWRKKPLSERMTAMRQAAGLDNFMLRVKDVPAVIDQLEKWNRDDGHELKGRLDLGQLGMSGHSFGAVTAQAVSGQRFPVSGTTLTELRIKAAIAFSPSAPKVGTVEQAFGEVKIPWMLMTGTKDVSPIGNADVKSRLSVFTALPAGNKYEVVLNNAEHSAFTDRALPGDREKRNPNHHRAIEALSTAFWDAYLRNDAAAKKWLNGDGPRSVLENSDQWERK